MAFTAGLVADIGVLALAQVDGTAYQKMYQQLYAAPHELIAAETVRFGTNHFRIGGLILGDFGLHAQIVHAIISLSPAESEALQQSSVLGQTLRAVQDMTALLTQGDRERWECRRVGQSGRRGRVGRRRGIRRHRLVQALRGALD
jgi:HD-like signal output (HDOD) protein